MITTNDIGQILLFCFLLILLTPFLGGYMARVFSGERHWFSFLQPIENSIYKISGINSGHGMDWKEYAIALSLFNLIGLIFVFAIHLLQGHLPWNPQNIGATSWHLAFNNAASFVTNTNWQSYVPEAAVSYGTQMLALGTQNFFSAATGIAVLLAFARGLASQTGNSLGNFWVDLTRSILYVLLPLSLVFALVLLSQGVVQSMQPAVNVVTLEGAKQSLPLGPAASQIAIKQLGTNGGGFFNANSAHPFENPTPLTNFLEMLAILLLPSALTFTFGKMVRAKSQGWTLFAVMFSVWLVALVAAMAAEYSINPIFEHSALMEGKEVRFGVTNSVIWSVSTTMASNGSVNAMISSLSPLAGGIAIFNIMLGEVIFGGVGSGLYGMILFVILTVFLAGLMVGRSPEYLGKKIEAREIKMTILAIIGPCAAILLGTGISLLLPAALSSLSAKGPHGLTEMLYAFTSSVGNNGSAFAGLNANTAYFNIVLGLAMIFGRWIVIIPALAVAGSLAPKKIAPPSAGTFSTDTLIFGVLLIGTILIVGALTFVPALSLGPIVEHLLMQQKTAF